MSLVKSPLFSPALLCALCSVAFIFGEGSVSWLWRNQPWIGIALAVASVVLWVLLARDVSRRGAD